MEKPRTPGSEMSEPEVLIPPVSGPESPGPEDDEIVIDDPGHRAPLFHPWFAVRPPAYALAAVTLTVDAEAGERTQLLAAITDLDYSNIRVHLDQHHPRSVNSDGRDTSDGVEGPGGLDARRPLHVVDLCAGVGTMAAAGSALGCKVSAIDNAAVPTLMNRLLHSLAADEAIQAADPSRGWAGLFSELRTAVDTILAAIPVGGANKPDRVWVRSTACNSCGLYIPLVRDWRVTRVQRLRIEFDADSPVPQLLVAPIAVPGAKASTETADGPYQRQGLTCPRCGQLNTAKPAECTVVLPAADVRRPGTQARTVDDHSPRSIVPLLPTPAAASLNPAAVWGWSPRDGTLVTLDAARTRHQQAYVDRLVDMVNQVSLDLEARTRLSPLQREAVVSGCALLVSAQSTNESTMAAWSPVATSSSIRSPAFQAYPALMFSENGSALRARLFADRARRLLDQVRWVRDTLQGRVTVLQGDAGQTGLPDACADAVVWDPPVGDNIDYEAAAFPYEQVLSQIRVSTGDSAGMSRLVPPPSLPPAVLTSTRTHRNDVLAASADGIRRQAAEARRLLRPEGRVGVYWYAATSEALQDFLDLVAPSGLQLEQAIPVRDSHAYVQTQAQDNNRHTYLLILRSVTESARTTSSGIDAQTVLTRVEQDLPVLNEGLVAVLERHYDPEDLEALVPPEYRGTLNQKVTEYVASHPEPGSLLTELGRKALQAELRTLHAVIPADADSRAMSAMLLSLLGFSVPRPEGFTVADALRTATSALEALGLATDLTAVRGQSTTLAVTTERILRFAITSWAMCAERTTGSDWIGFINETLETFGTKRLETSNLSFGDWTQLFTLLPKRLAADPDHASVFTSVHGAIKKARAAETLSAMVRARNSVAHDKTNVADLTPSALARQVHDDSARAVRMLYDLHRSHDLPRTLRPVEEIRDVYGRRRLVLVDDQDSRVEVFVKHEHDLTRPLVYLTSGSNPRDVDPTLLDLDEALAALPH